MTTEASAPPVVRGNARATLAAACVVGPLMTLVVTGPSVAVPAIGADLGSSLSAAQWVVDGYMLTASSSLAAMGSLADRIGYRRMFTGGLAFFAFWMAVSGLAGSILLLDVARAVAGFGGGAALASISAIVAQAFDGPARAKAFGLFGTFLGAGLAFGPMVGGLLVNAWGWRSVFLVLGGVAALVLLSAPLLPRSQPNRETRFDWPGSASFSLGIALFVFALVEAATRGWGDPLVLAALAGFAVLMCAFVVIERRARAPMFDLALFAQRRFLAVCLVPFVLAFSFVALVIVLPPYLTAASGMSAVRIGLVLLLLTGPSLVVPALTGIAAQKVSIRTLFVVLLLVSALGAAWMTALAPGAGTLELAGPLLCLGTGYGISLGILDSAAVSSVEPERMGMAAGMFNTVRLTSDVVSMAGLGALVAALTRANLAGSGPAENYPGGAGALTSQVLQGDMDGAVDKAAAAGAGRGSFVDTVAGAYTSGLHTTMWIVCAACALSATAVGALLAGKQPGAAGTDVSGAAEGAAEDDRTAVGSTAG